MSDKEKDKKLRKDFMIRLTIEAIVAVILIACGAMITLMSHYFFLLLFGASLGISAVNYATGGVGVLLGIIVGITVTFLDKELEG